HVDRSEGAVGEIEALAGSREGEIEVSFKFRAIVERQIIADPQGFHIDWSIELCLSYREIAVDPGPSQLDGHEELYAGINLDRLSDMRVGQAHLVTKIGQMDQDSAADLGPDEIERSKVTPMLVIAGEPQISCNRCLLEDEFLSCDGPDEFGVGAEYGAQHIEPAIEASLLAAFIRFGKQIAAEAQPLQIGMSGDMRAVEFQGVADMGTRHVEGAFALAAGQEHIAVDRQAPEIHIAADLRGGQVQKAADPDCRQRNVLRNEHVLHEKRTLNLGALQIERPAKPGMLQAQRAGATKPQHIGAMIEARIVEPELAD
ncbi:MAG TPA: hypothetical protein VHQ39_03550, partial [Dongiaceae bacterium]|nr:hypothetical protein [Dongiaceae bacterium]